LFRITAVYSKIADQFTHSKVYAEQSIEHMADILLCFWFALIAEISVDM